MKSSSVRWLAVWFAGGIGCAAWGGTPTLSMEAVVVNGRPVRGGSTSALGALPGDLIGVEVNVRDWSPNGEKLYAYQVQLDAASFTSGPRGYIEPDGYEATQQKEDALNPEAMYVDTGHARYVHKDLKAVAPANTRDEEYRVASVMLPQDGPVSPQDGKKYYCATIQYRVSANAEGRFTLMLKEGDDFSGLREPPGKSILPLVVEPLAVVVPGMKDGGYLALVVDRLNDQGVAMVADPRRRAAAGAPDAGTIVARMNGGE